MLAYLKSPTYGLQRWSRCHTAQHYITCASNEGVESVPAAMAMRLTVTQCGDIERCSKFRHVSGDRYFSGSQARYSRLMLSTYYRCFARLPRMVFMDVELESGWAQKGSAHRRATKDQVYH